MTYEPMISPQVRKNASNRPRNPEIWESWQGVLHEGWPIVTTIENAAKLLGMDSMHLQSLVAVQILAHNIQPWGRHANGQYVYRFTKLRRLAIDRGLLHEE